MQRRRPVREISNHGRSYTTHLWLRITIPAVVLCFVGLGAWRYFARLYTTPPPGLLRTARPVPKAAIRLDSQTASQLTVQPAPQPSHDYSLSADDYMRSIACYVHPRREIDKTILAKMGAAFPTLSQILASDDPNLDPRIVRRLLQNLLDAAKTAPHERKPALLVTADTVAERLTLPAGRAQENPDLQRELDTLSAEGLTFKWSEMDGEWFYQNDLLWRIWREYPSSDASGDSLVLLLRLGWTGKPCCDETLDPFRAVIQHGEEFLAKQSNSAHRQDILFLLAQAYETWWSLGQVPEENREEADLPPTTYREGSAAAREKAIAYYGEVVANAPESVEAECSRKPLELLKNNQDTHQRRFICYCD